MIKANIYTLKGSKVGEFALPKDIFEQKINLNLLAQANHVYQERGHVGLRNTKTRSEVNRTTKKLYKQKGTGGARHGSRRANVFVGGGIVFGPRAIRRVVDMSQSIKKAAIITAFSVKAKAAEIVVLRGLSALAKTKEAAEFLNKLTTDTKAKRFTFFISDTNLKNYKALRNIQSVTALPYTHANAFNVFQGGLLVLDEDIFEVKKEVKAEKTEKPVKTVKKAVKKTK